MFDAKTFPKHAAQFKSDLGYDHQGQGRSMAPPSFQLNAAPIQRQVVDSFGAEVNYQEVEEYALDHNIEVTSFDKLKKSFANEQKDKSRDLSIAEFLEKDHEGDSSYYEKQSKQSERSAAPEKLRRRVYGPDTANPFYKGDYAVGKFPKAHGFSCTYCPNLVYVDPKSGREIVNGKLKKRKPPVLHDSELPAAYIQNIFDENAIKYLGGDTSEFEVLKKETGYWRRRNEAQWDEDLINFSTGHKSCNSRQKDTRWRDLPEKDKNKKRKRVNDVYEQEIQDYINSRVKKPRPRKASIRKNPSRRAKNKS